MGKSYHYSLLLGALSVVMVLHYCLGLAHPTKSKSNFLLCFLMIW
ncbi:hypothetical protein DCAR_0521122 [Daucus carota subsp. sativus]|uniref:Uncharacterized protein n=1 Tax=Daucus carota subsp. sativus TaxID=79200 RepID=A0AAF0X775_DAUCS|nr:hypothetical protein DCAR_0521122 [Daucus carota subsp. sativus]